MPLVDDAFIYRVLSESKTIAVVGLSPKPERHSYRVASYLLQHGYEIIPVHPRASEVLGLKAYRDLASIRVPVDIINVFRRSDQVLPVVLAALHLRPRVIWLQLGIVNQDAARAAEESGIPFVQDKCIMLEHKRLLGAGTCTSCL
ncbi:MAG: CoA-binding protein [Desulfotomaculales bacterium]